MTTRGRVTKKVRYRTSGRKGQITVVGCANASGQVIPPMIIYDAARLNPAWTRDEVPGTKYGLSPNGWINTDLCQGKDWKGLGDVCMQPLVARRVCRRLCARQHGKRETVSFMFECFCHMIDFSHF